MNRRSVTIITAALLVFGGGAYYASSTSGQQQAPAKKLPKKILPASIQLEIVIDGGFAYIPSGDTLNIAFLEDFRYTGANDANKETTETTVFCDVDQMGTDLDVLEGEVVVPGPAQRKFNLDGAAVSFPALDASSGAISASRGPRSSSPFTPVSPDIAAQWTDLRFVSSLKAEHGASLNPKWRFLVNGFMTLKGGTLAGQKPLRFAHETFDFKRGSASEFVQSLTDRTLYTANVNAGQIEILLHEATAGVEKIVVKPSGSSRTVRLAVTGKHQQNNKPIVPGQELKEHCAFYQLLDPIPQPETWLRPHLVVRDAESLKRIPRTPGFFCPGDWF